MKRLGALLLASLLGLAACGLPDVEPHGLEVEAFESAPRGDAFRVGQTAPLGTWIATVDGAWTRQRRGGAAETGSARLVLEQTTQALPDGRTTSRITLSVERPEGLAEELIGGLDGVIQRVDRDPSGRVVFASRRFEAPGPPGSELTLDGLMFAGFGTGRPWVPAREVRVGEVWPRSELGQDPRELHTWGLSGAEPRSRGGAKLLGASDAGVRVALDALTEIQGVLHLKGAPSRNISFGVRTHGQATLDPVTGQPRQWEADTTIRYRGDDGAGPQIVDVTEHIVGTVIPQ